MTVQSEMLIDGDVKNMNRIEVRNTGASELESWGICSGIVECGHLLACACDQHLGF